VPYKLTRPLGWSGGYNGVRLYLYDSNHPRDSGCYLTFQDTGTTLSFNYTKDATVTSANGFTLGVLTMDQALYNSVDLPWVFGVEYIADLILSPASLSVSNLAGQATGTVGNSLVAQIPGVIPSLLSKHDLILTPRQMALQRTIQGTGSGTYTYASIAPPDPAAQTDAFKSLLPDGATAIAPGHRSITLQDVPVTPATRDTVLLGPDHQAVQITTTDPGKPIKVTLAQKYDVHTGAAPKLQTASRAQVVELGGLSLAQGETLTVWCDATLGQVGVTNSGAAKKFTVSMTSLDLATGKPAATYASDAAIGANADLALAVADWRPSGTLAVTQKQGALSSLLPANFQKPTMQ